MLIVQSKPLLHQVDHLPVIILQVSAMTKDLRKEENEEVETTSQTDAFSCIAITPLAAPNIRY